MSVCFVARSTETCRSSGAEDSELDGGVYKYSAPPELTRLVAALAARSLCGESFLVLVTTETTENYPDGNFRVCAVLNSEPIARSYHRL